MNKEVKVHSRRLLKECSENGIPRIRGYLATKRGLPRPQGHACDSADSAIVPDTTDIQVPGERNFTSTETINLLEEGIVQHDSLDAGVLSYNNRDDTSEEFQKLRIVGNLLYQSENKLQNTLDKYRRAAVFTDCEIWLTENVFHVHKCILASVSKVFHCLFLEKPATRCVHVPHVSSAAFALLLDYVYIGRIDFQAKTMVDFLDVLDGAIYLGISEVAEFCIKVFMDNLTHATVIDLLNAACRHKLAPAKSAAVKFLQDNAAFMIKRPGDLQRVHPNVLIHDLQIHMADLQTDVTAAMTEYLRQFCNIQSLALLSGKRRSDGGILDTLYTAALSTQGIQEPFKSFDPPKRTPEAKFAAAVACTAERIILAGGSTDSANATASVHSLDTEFLKWNEEASMSTARTFFTLTPFMWNGLPAVVAHGGLNGKKRNLDTSELLAFHVMDSWQSCPKLPCALHAHAAAVVDDESKIYITGGGPGRRKTTFSLKSGETKWQNAADMREARADHSMCHLNGTLYVFGGDETHVAAEEYDLLTGQWTMIPNLPEPGKYYATCTVVTDWVALVGGEDNQIFVFNSRTKSWHKSAQKLPWKKLIWPSCCVLTRQSVPGSCLPATTSVHVDTKSVHETNSLGHHKNCRCLNCAAPRS